MRTGIKIFIALVFIISSFLIGRYYCIKNCTVEKKKMNSELQLLKTQNELLTDSIKTLIILYEDTLCNIRKENQGITKNIVNLADSAKNLNNSNKKTK